MLERLKLLVTLAVLFVSASASAAQTIVVVGDSLSSGYGLTAEQSWVSMLRERLASEAYGYDVVNASIAGDTSAGGLARLPRLLEEHSPDVVVIELGGNDGLRGQPVDTLRANLAKMIELSQQRGARVLLAGMQIPPNYGAGVHASVCGRVFRARDALSRRARRLSARGRRAAPGAHAGATASTRMPPARRSCSTTFGACFPACCARNDGQALARAYPPGVPAEIDPDRYASLCDLLDASFARYAAAPAFSNLGSTLTFAEVDG